MTIGMAVSGVKVTIFVDTIIQHNPLPTVITILQT